MKDYKKILEGVVNIINTTEKSDIGFANICSYIGENCPELKEESEDENIRKTLLESFYSYKDEEWIRGIKVKDVIAWLEKQGEQKPADKVEPKFKVGDKIKYSSNVYDVLAVKEHYYELSNGNVCEFKNQDKWQLVEQKPTWSEEDETYLDHIITAVKLYYPDDKGKENPWRNELLRWLKSLKDRIQPQPRQEWSGEDEKILKDIITDVKFVQANSYKKIAWLKSLRPQNTWKPSDKQLDALERVVLERQSIALESLYEDIRKLK